MTASLAVCSWSLRPKSPGDLIDRMRSCGIDAVQIALDPIRTGAWDEAEAVSVLRASGIRIISGMMTAEGEDYSTLETIRETGGVRQDRTWPANLAAARSNAELAARLGVQMVTLHAGFIPHDREDQEWSKLIERLRVLVDVFAGNGVHLGFETGQEDAATLLTALEAIDRPTAGINFDPANMILYGMGDPVEACIRLAPHIRQIHIKDAVHAPHPGAWGAEVATGEGVVDWNAFFRIIGDRLTDRDLVIERESGEHRVKDVRAAAELVRSHARWIGHP